MLPVPVNLIGTTTRTRAGSSGPMQTESGKFFKEVITAVWSPMAITAPWQTPSLPN